MEQKKKVCANKGCKNEFKQFKTTDKFCSFICAKANQKAKPVKTFYRNKVSKPQAIINAQYSADRIVYLGKPENKFCFIDGCKKLANTVEHTKGRGRGYFDKEAEDKNICKTLDQRYWKPCCLDHNLELERNPELSKKYQLSKLHDGKKI